MKNNTKIGKNKGSKKHGLITGVDVLRKLNLFYVLIFYFIIVYINAWFAINAPDYEMHSPPLYDRGFNLLNGKISNIYSEITLFGPMLFFILRWFFTNKNVLANYFLLVGSLLMLRVVVFMMTEVPSTSSKCTQKLWKRKQEWSPKHFKWLLTSADNNTCADNMFSGHTTHITAMTLFTLYYSKNIMEKALFVISTIATMILLVWSRMHYTSDVIIAVFITIGAFFTL